MDPAEDAAVKVEVLPPPLPPCPLFCAFGVAFTGIGGFNSAGTNLDTETAVTDKKVTSLIGNPTTNFIDKEQENNSQDVQNSFETENLPKPYVLMVVGVNGVGKTTTIGKLAHNFQKNGKKVVLGAADTFRAAAVDQLKLWGQRVGVEVIDHGMNTDPSSVAYDAIKVGVEKGADVIIIDTAGRLHTKVNLMNELGKIKRVMQKILPEAPHEVMLVLDGSTGQNAVIQAREFTKVTEVNSLTITKLDGTAKGGVVIGISDEFKIPVKYIGVGEKMEDLQVFNKMAFVDSLFKK